MKDGKKWMALVFICASCVFLSPNRVAAQSGPPALPSGIPLTWWAFDDTNWLTAWNLPPVSSTNLDLVPSWAYNALQLDRPDPAWLQYKIVEANNRTNLNLTNGTLRFWFKPDWNTGDTNGGPGDWGMLAQVGEFSTNSSNCASAWGFYFDAPGSNLYFSAQGTNGFFTNYLSAPVALDSNTWTLLTLTWSASNTSLFVNDQLATTGEGVAVRLGSTAISNGFFIGSDNTGGHQARGQYEDMLTFNYQQEAIWVSNYYAFASSLANPPLLGGGFGTFGMGSGMSLPDASDTNSLWLEIQTGTNAYNSDTNSVTVLLHNTIPDVAYQLLSQSALTNTNAWTVEQNLFGAADSNITVTTVSMTNRPTLFFRALAYTLDTDGDGLPDWWENLYGLDPSNPDTGNTGIPDGYKQDTAGDGYNNLEKYAMSVAPNVWVTPRVPAAFSISLGTNGTTVSLNWMVAPGPVTNYLIQRADPNDPTNFQTIAAVSGTNNSYVDSGSFTVGDPMSMGFGVVNDDGSIYRVCAEYTGGNSPFDYSSEVGTPANTSCTVNGRLVRGPNGRWQIAFSAIPTNLQTIQLVWQTWDYVYDDAARASSQTIAVSNLVNGSYIIPDSVITNYLGFRDIPHGTNLGSRIFVQGIGPIDSCII